MSSLHRWRRGGTVLAALLLVFAVYGCTNHSDSLPPEESSTEVEEIYTEEEVADYIISDIMLPEDFNLMNYPVEAVIIQDYTQGLPYYTGKEDAKSFWFTMAVLSSLLEEHGVMETDLYRDYCFYEKEEIDAFASALYSRYASGNMDLPDVDDGDPYVRVYNERAGKYGFLNGNIGDLGIRFVSCEESGTGYVLSTQLVNQETGEDIAAYQVSLKPMDERFKEKNNRFSYSVSGLTVVSEKTISGKSETEEESSETTKGEKNSAGKDVEKDKENNPEKDTENDPDGVIPDTEGDSSEGAATDPEPASDGRRLNQEEALSLAESFMGENMTCCFRQMITLNDNEYYDFTIEGGNSVSTDILVCINGSDVVTGVQNEDGSWSLDP